MATAHKAFRARAFDSNRSLAVYWSYELPDLSECSSGSRAVTQMPSGMEKEEEMESHLQDAILAQQASTSGISVNHVIPTPRVNQVDEDRYNKTYLNRNTKLRSKYIKVHAWQALERDEPDYDYDTEDEEWLQSHPHVDPKILEKVFDTVESHSSETQIASEDSVISLNKLLDASIVNEVYDYWVTKRLKAATTSGCIGVGGLIPRVRTECRKDGQGAVNPYVAFRRRAEKMQTRKNRKNDEDSYEKVLKLVHDMSKAQQLFDMMARREKQKLALIDVEAELLSKRMEMSDFGSANAFNEITERMRLAKEASDPPKPFSEINGSAQEDSKKRKKAKRRPASCRDLVSKAWLKKNADTWNRPPSIFGHGGASGVTVVPKTRPESTADGRYTFKRRRGCTYRAARSCFSIPPSNGAVPTFAVPSAPQAVIPPAAAVVAPATVPRNEDVPSYMRYYETQLPCRDGSLRSIGFARRRVGRGGRVFFDRMPTQRNETEKVSTDPWAEYCVADSTKVFRPRHNSLQTEEETEEQSPKSRYFARSDRVNFNDYETEREWISRYHTSWRDAEDEPSEKFEDLKEKATQGSTSNENDDSEVERMDVESPEDEAQITDSKERAFNGNGNEQHDKNEDDVDMDVDEPPQPVIRHMNGGKVKPLQEHSPPLSGNGRADRADPTPVPAKMCGTVSDSDEWREPSGSPSESNSSTEWNGYGQDLTMTMKATMKFIAEEDEEPSPAARARDHSIKEFFDVNGNNAGTEKVHSAFDDRDVM